jgi:hypothetical protein
LDEAFTSERDAFVEEGRRSKMSDRQPSGWAIGWTFFAAFMMITLGILHIINGLVAIFDDEFFVVGKEYIFKFDVTTWGWIHLILGIVVLLAGFGLFAGRVWARTVGVIIAVVASIAGFAWIPYYPGWGIVLIAISIGVIWALTAHGRDVEQT